MEERIDYTEAKVLQVITWWAKDKEATMIEARCQGIEEYKASTEFQDKLAMSSVKAYGHGFEACCIQVRYRFSKVDIKSLNPKANEDEDEVEASYTMVQAKHVIPSPPIESEVKVITEDVAEVAVKDAVEVTIEDAVEVIVKGDGKLVPIEATA